MHQRRPAYLLIELVAAITLVAIAAACMIPGAARQSDAAKAAGLLHQILDLDRRARIMAIREAPVRISTAGHDLTATSTHDEQHAVRVRCSGQVYLLDPVTNAELRSISVDRLGRTPDYVIVWHARGGTQRVTVDGLTGRSAVHHPEPAP